MYYYLFHSSHSIASSMLSVLCRSMCIVLDNVWDNTRRMLKEKGVIPKTCDSVRAQKCRESFHAGRPGHKNYKLKKEPVDTNHVTTNVTEQLEDSIGGDIEEANKPSRSQSATTAITAEVVTQHA
jgi:hypothetical protein